MTTRKCCTKEFKLDAIRLVTEHGCSKAEVARSLGINANMLGCHGQRLVCIQLNQLNSDNLYKSCPFCLCNIRVDMF